MDQSRGHSSSARRLVAGQAHFGVAVAVAKRASTSPSILLRFFLLRFILPIFHPPSTTHLLFPFEVPHFHDLSATTHSVTMASHDYYQGGGGGPQYPQQSYGGYPQQGYPQQGYPQQGYPQQQYQQGPPMQYSQPPPQQVIVKQKKDRGCLGACLAALCCCFVCEEGCECCADCCECCLDM